MDEINARNLLSSFDSNRQLVVSGQDKRWQWRPGTLLFPEGRCCYCGAVVRSNRLWVAESGWLRGQLKLDGDTAVWERPNHPHAGTDGGMCLGGTTDDLVTILFFAVNPTDTLRWHNQPAEAAAGIRAWYAEMFGHACKTAEAEASGILVAADGIFAAVTPVHRDRPPNCPCSCGCNSADGSCDCGCPSCVCDWFTCELCGEEHRNSRQESPSTGESICQRCYDERWTMCRWCRRHWELNTGYVVGQYGHTYCPQHVEYGNGLRAQFATTAIGDFTWTGTTTLPTEPQRVERAVRQRLARQRRRTPRPV